MPTAIRVALVQMNSRDSVASNLAAVEKMTAEAASRGAQLVALPEYFFLMAGPGEYHGIAEEEPGAGAGPVRSPIQKNMMDLASRHGVYLLAGSLPLKGPPGESRLVSASILYTPEGRSLARYDKRHLFDQDVQNGRSATERHRESDTFAPGEKIVTARIGEAVLGFSICYDLRFPEHYRSLVGAGAEILFAPAAFTHATGEAHWHVLVRARAIENQCYVLAPAQWGEHPGGKRTFGHSLAVGPGGEILAEGPGEGDALLVVDLDLERLRKLRRDFRSCGIGGSFSLFGFPGTGYFGAMTTHYGQLDITWGWIFISLGITTGSILGLWSFAGPLPAPKGHANYTDLPRRLNRLAHIACFMLPLITIVYGQHLDQAMLTDFQKLVGSYGMLICMVGVPLFLFLASFHLPFKYFEVIPVGAGTLALYLMSWAHLKLLLQGWQGWQG